MASLPGKRKPAGSIGASRKRAKTYDARTLAVQSTEAALSATGELDVAAYAAARTFEIQALEKGMQRSKGALTTRAFQKVPRSLPPADAKYRKRQRCKTWLPTHLFHAKRAHMATTKSPLWRFAIPISPTEKSYRPTHRARGSRGAVAWDMSYMSTIQLDGNFDCIEAVLRAVGVEGDEAWGTRGRKWRLGTRVLQAWTYEKDNRAVPIAPVTLLWSVHTKPEDIVPGDSTRPSLEKARRKLWVRVHPSAFLQLWTDLLDLSKRQNPHVTVEDLRFEIGSIEITGPGSTEALIAALRPVRGEDGTAPDPRSPVATWSGLLGVTNPSSLPQNALLSFDVSDPRLHFPPQRLEIPEGESHMVDLANLFAQIVCRLHVSFQAKKLSIVVVRKLARKLALEIIPPPQPNDPRIPVLVFATRHSDGSKQSSAPGSWTVLLPWKCVPPVWYSLMYYPLSSGGSPRFGGLKEQQQLAFEAGEPWFPGDYPGTRAGWEWGQMQAQKSQAEWERRPKGRRPAFDSLTLGEGRPKGEIGRGWACDWERLIQGPPKDVQGNSSSKAEKASQKETENVESPVPPLNIHSLRFPLKNTDHILANLGRTPPSSSGLATVYITLSNRGTPEPCARIYRLPTDQGLRQKWTDLKSSAGSKLQAQHHRRRCPSVSGEQARRKLAESLISATAPENSKPDCLEVPPEKDLIGFITTGNYNLSEGKATGIGSILLHKVLVADFKQHERRMCIIRGSGERTGRLGVWELV
ncbi:hypothetical protein N7468_000660 [Penicillium chermesinum]|uniref:Uncharacterized protein n=1 Tax=Penicillium chermesinum TaxID=63820 RepID=A0A9W9PM23_9EURO|nr:uncharacterized protein N7468_000660 [Penicillium chermesinum]KAJ5249209.1 hypothetical protein N7468_000660 [Penicillium chermesinum]